MPEIAEVFTLAGGLASLLEVPFDSSIAEPPINHPLIKWSGCRLLYVRDLDGGKVFKDERGELEALLGARPARVRHRGKALALDFEKRDLCLHFHFGMTGRLGLVPSTHSRVVLDWEKDGKCEYLYYIDPRKFGHIRVEPAGKPLTRGVDALELTESVLAAICARSRRKIRSVLTDQGLIAGIGNYLVNECLWKARINPFQPASTLPAPAIALLLKTVQETILASARAGGATLLDYFGLGGEPGTYQKSINVYRKEDCPRCGGRVSRVRNPGEQSSYFCPACQPLCSPPEIPVLTSI
jgi:formamidopyrimidine-DNA glycosylase